MADQSGDDGSVPAGGNFWPPPTLGNGDPLQLGGPESWTTP